MSQQPLKIPMDGRTISFKQAEAAGLLPVMIEPKELLWIVITQSCAGCGSHMAVRLFYHHPTEEQIKTVKDGMPFCSKTLIKEIDLSKVNDLEFDT
jgi:hypothetical protein